MTCIKHIRFGASACGEPVVKALDYLRLREIKQLGQAAPLAVVSKPWQRHVLLQDGSVDPRAYTFCALDELRTALRRRDVFEPELFIPYHGLVEDYLREIATRGEPALTELGFAMANGLCQAPLSTLSFCQVLLTSPMAPIQNTSVWLGYREIAISGESPLTDSGGAISNG
jgi:hypothetical protein